VVSPSVKGYQRRPRCPGLTVFPQPDNPHRPAMISPIVVYRHMVSPFLHSCHSAGFLVSSMGTPVMEALMASGYPFLFLCRSLIRL